MLNHGTLQQNSTYFWAIVGTLQHFPLTPLDIYFAVNKLSQCIMYSYPYPFASIITGFLLPLWNYAARFIILSKISYVHVFTNADGAGNKNNFHSTAKLGWLLQSLVFELGYKSATTPTICCDNIGTTHTTLLIRFFIPT